MQIKSEIYNHNLADKRFHRNVISKNADKII